MPSTLGRLELTGNTVPPNGLLSRFHSTVRPTLPGRSVAPITATLRGANNGIERMAFGRGKRQRKDRLWRLACWLGSR